MSAETPDQLLLSAPDAARRLSISPRTLWRLEKDGKIPSVRIGTRVLFSPSSLQSWIDAQLQSAAK